MDAALLAAAGPRNHLWVAAELGIARHVWFVSPPAALSARLATLDRARADLPIRIDAQAHPRELDGRAPVCDEAVLLDVNASWFDEGEPGTWRAPWTPPGSGRNS